LLIFELKLPIKISGTYYFKLKTIFFWKYNTRFCHVTYFWSRTFKMWSS